MENIKVSIVTPSYNQGHFLKETIESVLNQTYSNIEYIVVDGNSKDNSAEILKSYQGRIDKIIIERDKGQSDAINKGFRLATGEIVGWLNSDDVLHPYCVEDIVAAYRENPRAAIIYGSTIDFIDEHSHKVGKETINIPDKGFLVKKSSSVIQPGSFYNAAYLKKINFLDESLHYCMDLDLWLRLLNEGDIVACRQRPLALFRTYATNKSSTGAVKYSRERRKVLSEHGGTFFNETIFKSHWYDLKYRLGSIFKR